MLNQPSSHSSTDDIGDDSVFGRIASDLHRQGFSVIPNALPEALAAGLFSQVLNMDSGDFSSAGIGRNTDLTLNQFVRRDEIHWIEGHSPPEQLWLTWTHRLQQYLNRRLFLGLFSYESHFAHYQPGDFYRKHLDAFRGEANRRLSTVAYLNPGWLPDDGGELVIYEPDTEQEITKVTPAYGTLVVFLSEEFPHEVLTAKRHRYSIAGWFRVNGSSYDRVDPPR
ncbi:MAG: 2OG-Fe(II) oxygenase [Gammaproteobacteria bacterium]|nr:MAG: 2OG-Fe(II) oxygenase [Gammaproteobacteria bacterium]